MFLTEALRPKVLDSVFLDFTDLAQNAELWKIDGKTLSFADLRPDDIPKAVRYLAQLDGEALARLVHGLFIDAAAIDKRLPPEQDISGKLIVLHTGWTDKLAPKRQNLSSFSWEGVHPWLLHPWLDKVAITTLIGRGIAGIAIDAPMPDCPLYIAGNTIPVHSALVAARKLLFEHGFDYSPVPHLEKRQPVHVELLIRFLILAEGLSIPECVNGWYSSEKQFFETDLFWHGLYYHMIPDGTPIKLIAKCPDHG
jgi:hypothetical protein